MRSSKQASTDKAMNPFGILGPCSQMPQASMADCNKTWILKADDMLLLYLQMLMQCSNSDGKIKEIKAVEDLKLN